MSKIKNFFKKFKTEELLVSKKEVEEEIKKENLKNPNKKHTDIDSEPSWYHYVIVLIVLFSVFGIVYSGFEFFGKSDQSQNPKFLTKTFNYPYQVGNITYNIKFNYPTFVLDESNFTIEPSKIDILNTINFSRVYYSYSGSDNGQVTIASVKVRNFLKYVYKINFGENLNYGNYTCKNSTLNSKLMIFDINSTRSGVFYNSTNGCVTFETPSSKDFVLLGDKFIYEMIKQ